MLVTNLCTKADLDWLFEVHLPAHWDRRPRVKLAVVHGNQDWPDKAELFEQDHYRCKPLVFEANEFGILVPVG
jgi:hypothetical protein